MEADVDDFAAGCVGVAAPGGDADEGTVGVVAEVVDFTAGVGDEGADAAPGVLGAAVADAGGVVVAGVDAPEGPCDVDEIGGGLAAAGAMVALVSVLIC